MPYSPVNVSNNLLRRAFEENIEVSPMKLQKLLYYVASEYAKRTQNALLDGAFQAWRYGPVMRSVYDEFRSFGGQPIRAYGKDAKGNAYVVDETTDPQLREVLDTVWSAAKGMTAVSLSRLTHSPGSGWSKALEESRTSIKHDYIRDDTTYRQAFGLPESVET